MPVRDWGQPASDRQLAERSVGGGPVGDRVGLRGDEDRADRLPVLGREVREARAGVGRGEHLPDPGPKPAAEFSGEGVEARGIDEEAAGMAEQAAVAGRSG